MLDTTLLLLDGFFPLNEIKSQHRTVNDRSCLNKRLLGTPKSKCEHETYQIISKCELKLDVRHCTGKILSSKKESGRKLDATPRAWNCTTCT